MWLHVQRPTRTHHTIFLLCIATMYNSILNDVTRSNSLLNHFRIVKHNFQLKRPQRMQHKLFLSHVAMLKPYTTSGPIPIMLRIQTHRMVTKMSSKSVPQIRPVNNTNAPSINSHPRPLFWNTASLFLASLSLSFTVSIMCCWFLYR